MSLERRALLTALGAELVLTEPERVMDGALEAARRAEQQDEDGEAGEGGLALLRRGAQASLPGFAPPPRVRDTQA